jgi:hypothetical protein
LISGSPPPMSRPMLGAAMLVIVESTNVFVTSKFVERAPPARPES